MKIQEWNWITKDSLQIYSKEWSPEIQPKAIICLVHGLGEHVGRYFVPHVTANDELRRGRSCH